MSSREPESKRTCILNDKNIYLRWAILKDKIKEMDNLGSNNWNIDSKLYGKYEKQLQEIEDAIVNNTNKEICVGIDDEVNTNPYKKTEREELLEELEKANEKWYGYCGKKQCVYPIKFYHKAVKYLLKNMK